jgi:hypothetical protein
VESRADYPQRSIDTANVAAQTIVFLGLLGGILLGGAVIAMYGPTAGVILTGAFVAVLLVVLPAHASAWLLFITVFLIVGPLVYFARIEKAFWIPFFMTTLLMVKVFFELPRARTEYQLHAPAFLIGLYAFMALFLFSALLNQTSAFGVFVSSKNYLFIWSVTLLIGLGALSERCLEQIWRFLLWVSLLQFPFAAIQRVFYARRSGLFNWDAVVGTFLVFTMLLASRLYSSSRISATLHWAVILCALGTIAMAEVKVIFVILPIGYAWLYRKEIPRRLGRTLLMGTLLCVMLASIFLIYKTAIYSTKTSSEALGATIERLITREAKAAYDPTTGDVSRTEALVRWWKLNPGSEPQFIFGHGPGASRVSQMAGAGAAASKYPFGLTTSTASVLLWDLGVSGYLLFVFILLAAAYCAECTARMHSMPLVQRCMLQVNAAMFLLIAVLTVYNRQAVDSPSVQVLIAAMLGHALFMARKYLAPSERVMRVGADKGSASVAMP